MTDLLDQIDITGTSMFEAAAEEERQSWTTEGEPELVPVDAVPINEGPRSRTRQRLQSRRGIIYLTALEGVGSLIRPLKVEVQPGDDVGYVAFAPGIEVGGTGDSLADAVRDLSSTAISLYEEFSRTPPQNLDESAARLLARLQIALGT